jgi:energy-coupling factor transporter transmembrane protein EcfT
VSPWGYLLFTAWAALATTMTAGWWLLGLALVELAFGLMWSRRGLRLLRRPRFWAFVLSAVALGPFLIGEPDVAVGPLRLSRTGFTAGLEMAGRAFTLTLAFGLGIASLSLSDVVAVFDRLGLRGLGFAVALAMNLLGTLREMATVTLQTIEVVNAAAVRAFDLNGGQPRPLPLRRADLWLLALLAGCTGALLAVGMR